MFRKLLSSISIMLCVFSLNTYAQSINPNNRSLENIIPEFSVTQPRTSMDIASNEFWWGYWNGDLSSENLRMLGNGGGKEAPVVYSACISIPMGASVGSERTVEALRFSFPDHKNISDLKVWMANALPARAEDANITCQSVPEGEIHSLMSKDGVFNEIRFAKPYKIEPSKNLFVGYSFTVNKISGNNEKYPLLVEMAAPTQENAMFLKLASDQNWYNYTGSQNGDLALQVLLSGKIENNSVRIPETFNTLYGAKDSEVVLPLDFENRGLNEVNDITLSLDVDGQKQQVDVKPVRPIKSNGTYSFKLNINTASVSGQSDVVVAVEKVNGEPNVCKENISRGKLVTLSKAGKKKVVVEEFTAFWCGACPIGMIGLQKLRQMFGDDIVLLSTHYKDDIACLDYVDFILSATANQYPNAHLDRTYLDIYPYAGSGKNGRVGKAGFGGFGMGKDVEALMKVLPVAEIEAGGILEGDFLTAKATTNFLYTGDTNHSLAFVITENGKHSEDWIQKNYLKDQHGWGWEDEEPLFDMWVNGESTLTDVIYDDVTIACKGVISGLANSIPSPVKEGEPVEYEVKFDLSEYPVIQNRENLAVVVFLIDNSTGKIVNGDFKTLKTLSGIDGVRVDSENVSEVARYTIDGRRIDTPQKGINIVRYSDGTVKKIVVD